MVHLIIYMILLHASNEPFTYLSVKLYLYNCLVVFGNALCFEILG
jgi:hypothetical protein